MTRRQAIVAGLQYYPVTIIPTILYLFVYQRRYIILANDALVRFYILHYIVGLLSTKLLYRTLISACVTCVPYT